MNGKRNNLEPHEEEIQIVDSIVWCQRTFKNPSLALSRITIRSILLAVGRWMDEGKAAERLIILRKEFKDSHDEMTEEERLFLKDLDVAIESLQNMC